MTEIADLMTPLNLACSVDEGYWRAPHLQLLEYEVMKTLYGDWDILVAMAPPRHGKSDFMSRRVPSWFHGVYPKKRSIVSSYAVDLARNHSRWVRDETHRVAPLFGHDGVNPLVSAASDWETFDRGGMLAAGVGGGITGRAADLFVIDDPLKNAEQAISARVRESQWEWWQTTAFTRMEPGGKMLMLATRWHEEDLLGMVLKHGIEEMGLRVREVRMPALSEGEGDPLSRPLDGALWPARYNQEALMRIRDTLDPYWWNALYQQRLGAYGKNEWPPQYFYGIFAQDDEWPERMALSATALDPSKGKNSKKGDYSAIVNVGFRDGFLWVDADIERRPVPQMMSDLVEFNSIARPTVTGIEGVAFQELLGESYIQAQSEAGEYRDHPVLMENSVNKEIRIARLGLWLRLHRVKIRNNAGGQMLVKQMKEFPNGSHDDGPDGFEMAVRLLISMSEDLQELSAGPASTVLSV